MTEKYGYWESNGTKFFNKFEALYYATNHKSNIEFKYHNDVWRNVNRGSLGKKPLNMLYRQRAQQLRDKYQYLVLYYSGGSDSHNILRTFIDNDIKLDEVCVRWPTSLIGSTIYTPDISDTSAKNYWSEWEFAISPILSWLVANKPDVKITIKDFAREPNRFDMSSMLGVAPHLRGGALLGYGLVSDSDIEQSALGKSVGHICGIDKPILKIDDENRVWMFFSDFCTGMIYSGLSDPESGEGFYWTPDFPNLAFEMAYHTCQYYNVNKEERKYLTWAKAPDWSEQWNAMVVQHQNEIVKEMCYTTWDGRFQANKPLTEDRSDKFFWFYERTEFELLRKQFTGEAVDRLSMLDDRFIKKSAYANQISESFYIRTLD